MQLPEPKNTAEEFIAFAIGEKVLLFGPAYKGIPLVAAVSMALADMGRDVPYGFNRKEAKTHGEEDDWVGAPLEGLVLIVDDVISAGTSVRESVQLIHGDGAKLAGVAVALDRQERGTGELSAIQEVQKEHGVPVIAIATLDNLISYLSRAEEPEALQAVAKVNAYRDRYGAKVA